MARINIGIVGMGNMGSGHAKMIAQEQSRAHRLAAVCDIDADKARRLGQQYAVPSFGHAYDMYDSGLVDVVLIATPHYWHGPLTVRAAGMGLHVLCEKPLAVSVSDARAMVAQCKKHKVALGCMFMQRTRYIMKQMKRMIVAGKLGEIFRVQMVCSNWLRTQEYYRSGAWRGTWDGEGGGVIMNQAPHSLDLFAWLAGGLPKSVIAQVDTRWHKIEVENTVNAICDFGGGRTGYIYATTAELPGTEQLIVAGTKGTLLAEGGRLRFCPLRQELRKFLMTAEAWPTVETSWHDVELETGDRDGAHINITNAFVDHILKGRKMVCSGEEALSELELSNAIYLSGFGGGKRVSLPVDARKVDALIARLERERSSGKGGYLRAAAGREMKRLLKK